MISLSVLCCRRLFRQVRRVECVWPATNKRDFGVNYRVLCATRPLAVLGRCSTVPLFQPCRLTIGPCVRDTIISKSPRSISRGPDTRVSGANYPGWEGRNSRINRHSRQKCPEEVKRGGGGRAKTMRGWFLNLGRLGWKLIKYTAAALRTRRRLVLSKRNVFSVIKVLVALLHSKCVIRMPEAGLISTPEGNAPDGIAAPA